MHTFLDRREAVKSAHNKDTQIIQYKKEEVAATLFFKSFIKIGDDVFEVVIATHELKGDKNENRSYLYEAYTETARNTGKSPSPSGDHSVPQNASEVKQKETEETYYQTIGEQGAAAGNVQTRAPLSQEERLNAMGIIKNKKSKLYRT
jgi:hypothetical protein